MIQTKEAMMAITQRQSAPPTLAQPVDPPPPTWATPPVRHQYIAPPVKPIPCEQILDGWSNKWQICTHCRRMGTHADDDCELLSKNKCKRDERLKRQKGE